MEEDEQYVITLFCKECDNPICRIGDVIDEDSKDRCVRQVDEELYLDYFHQIKEVWPFAHLESYDTFTKEYSNTLSILDKVYSMPVKSYNGRDFEPQILKE